MKKGIAVMACVVLAASLLAGCTSSTATQSSSPSSSSEKIALNENTSEAPVPLEQVSVTVYNGSVEGEDGKSIEGLAGRGASKLQELGVEQVITKNAAVSASFISYIAYRSPKYEQAAHEIADSLGINGAVFETGENSANGYYYDSDIALILCEDWALSEGLIDQIPEAMQRAIDQNAINFPDEIE